MTGWSSPLQERQTGKIAIGFQVDRFFYIRAHLSMNMASDEREAEFYSTLMPMLKKVILI